MPAGRSGRRDAGRRVLITGVSTRLGTQLARRLEADPYFSHVAGVDTRPPRATLGRLEFIEADIRQPTVMSRLAGTRFDALVHNNILRQPWPGMSPGAAHDTNVIGSLQLLAACERMEGLETIVVRGSAGIYGSEPAAPQFFTEEMARLYPLRTRFQRDVGEIEDYFATFSHRHPAVTCTMLRYQPAVGPALDTQVTRYLGQALVPTFLGYDPRLQFVHESDAVEALVAAVKNPVAGAVNVAGSGTIGLTRAIRLARKRTLPIPAPLFGTATGAGRRLGVRPLSPDFQRLLQYGRAVDITRLTDEVGYRPRYSTVEAVRDYVHRGSTAQPSPRPTRPRPRPAVRA